MLLQHPTGPAFGYRQMVTDMINTLTAPCGARKLPGQPGPGSACPGSDQKWLLLAVRSPSVAVSVPSVDPFPCCRTAGASARVSARQSQSRAFYSYYAHTTLTTYILNHDRSPYTQKLNCFSSECLAIKNEPVLQHVAH